MYIGNTANIVICWRKNTFCGTHHVTASNKCAGPGNEAFKSQCIFHSVGCDSAALLHKSHGQCEFPWMQALWHVNFPVVLSGDFFVYLLYICNSCILITMFNVHPPSSPFSLVLFSHSLYHHSLHPLSPTSSPPTSSYTVHFSLPHLPHCFLSCPLGCAFNNFNKIHTLHVTTQCVREGCSRCWVLARMIWRTVESAEFFF